MIRLKSARKNFPMYLLWILLAFSAVGCEKEYSNSYLPDAPNIGFEPDNRPPGYLKYYSTEAKLRDTVWYTTYQYYLWQDQLPPSMFTQNFRTAEALLDHLKSYAKSPNGNRLDIYSFLDRSKTIRDQINNSQSQGGFGFEVRYSNAEDLFVKKVDKNSPAHAAGMRRGWQIVEINGRANLSSAEMEKDNFEFLFSAIYGQHIAIKLRKPNGDLVALDLDTRPYSLNPIIASTIFEGAGGRSVGYLALDAFVESRFLQAPLQSVFTQFESANVSSVVLDLRYNGGGDVASANLLTNLLAPIARNGQLMMSYNVNDYLKSIGWDVLIFSPVAFNKTNSLNINTVYVLTTGLTASASELVINNLKPHMEVKVIGDAPTYGKPVGYFGVPILDVDLYAVSFQTFNSAGEGDYFDGIPFDQFAYDDVTRDFGDQDEAMLNTALMHAFTGSFPAVSPFRLLAHKPSANGINAISTRSSATNSGELNKKMDLKLKDPAHGVMFNSENFKLPLRQ